jgi:tRNA (guanine37-N1)-methyltransferase
MQFEVFTLLPEVFPPYLESSILQRARERGLIDVRIHNIRDYTHTKHHTTDDTPYGGGGGMVMKPEPVFEAIESVLGSRYAPQSAFGATRPPFISRYFKPFYLKLNSS